MKKNIVLVVILGALLLATFIFQEQKNEANYIESLTKDHLVSNIHHIKLPNIDAVKKEDSWWMNEQLLSHNAFAIIERKLIEIKKVKEVTGEWKSYFSSPVEIQVNDEVWTLGDISFDRQGFYLARDKKIYLVTIEGASAELTQDENEVAVKKYDELKGQIYKSREELLEKQLFRFYPKLPISKVVVESYERLPYELNLDRNETLPAPFPGIQVVDKIKEKFISLLTQVTIKGEVPWDEKLKGKKMGSLRFMGDHDVVWELWLKDDKTADSFIMDNKTKKAYAMIGGTLKMYFTMVQDYWDKKVIPPSLFTTFDRLPMLLSQGNKGVEVAILNREPLKFESKSKLNDENLMGLMQVIFNLDRFDQADRVSILSNSERKMVLNQDPLRVIVMEQELLLWLKAEELIVVNATQGFKAHFSLLHEKSRLDLRDMLK